MKKEELEQMKKMDAYIAIRASKNVSNSVNIPMEKLMLYEKYMDDVLNERVDNTKWVILRYPNDSMAQLAKMNTEDFEDFYFDDLNSGFITQEEVYEIIKSFLKTLHSYQWSLI